MPVAITPALSVAVNLNSKKRPSTFVNSASAVTVTPSAVGLIVKNYIMFYYVDEPKKLITIARVIYAHRNYNALLD